MKRITFVAAAALLAAGSTVHGQQAIKHDSASKHAAAAAKTPATHNAKPAVKPETSSVKSADKPVTTTRRAAATHGKTAAKTQAKPDSSPKKKTP